MGGGRLGSLSSQGPEECVEVTEKTAPMGPLHETPNGPQSLLEAERPPCKASTAWWAVPKAGGKGWGGLLEPARTEGPRVA